MINTWDYWNNNSTTSSSGSITIPNKFSTCVTLNETDIIKDIQKRLEKIEKEYYAMNSECTYKGKPIPDLSYGKDFSFKMYDDVVTALGIRDVEMHHCVGEPVKLVISCDKVESFRLHPTVEPKIYSPSLTKKGERLKIKQVHFSDPVTVVIWNDKTKTIVRTNDGEKYDPEKGLALAIAKRFLGTNESRSNYYDIFKEWLPKEEESDE